MFPAVPLESRRAAGVDVTLEIWAEMPHAWPAFAGLVPEADGSVERIGHWLREDRPAR
jgi:epsilon-lactone hydrolase